MSAIAVIGAAGGIGRVLVHDLLDEGRDVIALDLPTSLQSHSLACRTLPIDLLNDASIAEAVSNIKQMNVTFTGLVNLAGYTKGVTPLSDIAMDDFDYTIAGNLRGFFAATRAILPIIAQGGAVVTVASGLAQAVRPGHGAYAMAKAGILAMTKTMALEHAPRLRINAIAPGPVQTAFLTGGTGQSGEEQSSIIDVAQMAAAVPLGRIARPKDVTGPIRFLLSEESGFMTGQILWVNGGAYMP